MSNKSQNENEVLNERLPEPVMVTDAEIDEYVKSVEDIHKKMCEMRRYLARDITLPISVGNDMHAAEIKLATVINTLGHARENAVVFADKVLNLRRIKSITLTDNTVVTNCDDDSLF